MPFWKLPEKEYQRNTSLSPQVRSRLQDFEAICESGEVTMMNEMRYSVDEYIAIL